MKDKAMRFDDLVNLLLSRGYEPVHHDHEFSGDGLQLVNGQWYMPIWGCDTLQHVIDEYVLRKAELG